MAKHIILVHGRHYKPDRANLKRNWVAALEHGIERDYDKRALNKFKKAKKSMAYYGHLSNQFLGKHTGKRWTKKRDVADVVDRKKALAALKQYGTGEFTKSNYRKIINLDNVVKEAVANVFAGPLSLFGIGDEIVAMVAPDMEHYWNPDAAFGSDVRWQLTRELEKALKADDDILLVSHSLGTVVSYDVLWKFSHYGEYQGLRGKSINTLVTLGSPLGDENVKKQLKGSAATGYRRYPNNIGRWINIAAEDDFISHDPTLASDFKKMVSLGLTSSISDKHIYNMAFRDGHSNPHHGTGYLLHPEMSRVVKSWLG